MLKGCPLTLRPDLVLVKLAPKTSARRVSLITTSLDTFLSQKGIEEFQRLTRRQPTDKPIGVVVDIGTATQDVWPGDLVLLEPEAGQDVDLPDERGLPWPHLIVSELDIQAVIERTP